MTKMGETTLWLCVFYSIEDDNFSWLDQIFTDPVAAVEEGMAVVQADEELRLVQVALDSDHPFRWGQRLVEVLAENVDANNPAEVEAVNKVAGMISTFQPKGVSADLPSGGERLKGEK